MEGHLVEVMGQKWGTNTTVLAPLYSVQPTTPTTMQLQNHSYQLLVILATGLTACFPMETTPESSTAPGVSTVFINSTSTTTLHSDPAKAADPTTVHPGVARQESEVKSNWENYIKSGKFLDGDKKQIMFINTIGHGAIELRMDDIISATNSAMYHLGKNWPSSKICKNNTKVTNCQARIKSNVIGFKTAAKSIQKANIAASQICSNAPLTNYNIIKKVKLAGTMTYKSWHEKIYSHPISKRGYGAVLGIGLVVAGIVGISLSGSISNTMNTENLKTIQTEVETIDKLIEDTTDEIEESIMINLKLLM